LYLFIMPPVGVGRHASVGGEGALLREVIFIGNALSQMRNTTAVLGVLLLPHRRGPTFVGGRERVGVRGQLKIVNTVNSKLLPSAAVTF
jgi:hypothetical protein